MTGSSSLCAGTRLSRPQGDVASPRLNGHSQQHTRKRAWGGRGAGSRPARLVGAQAAGQQDGPSGRELSPPPRHCGARPFPEGHHSPPSRGRAPMGPGQRSLQQAGHGGSRESGARGSRSRMRPRGASPSREEERPWPSAMTCTGLRAQGRGTGSIPDTPPLVSPTCGS